ncbi:Bidirectional sugar transporter sweet2 [Sarracenia purpurea var. burkii]
MILDLRHNDHICMPIAGNIFAFGLFVSPIPTFRRIMRNKSTEHFSGLPYIYALLNCLLSAWYGTPSMSSDNLLVTTVNSIGAVFQITYISMFIIYAEKAKKLRMLGLLLAVFGLFAVIVAGSLRISDFNVRHLLIGCLSSASLVSMFASPLFVIVRIFNASPILIWMDGGGLLFFGGVCHCFCL